jgi:hypothetical protein
MKRQAIATLVASALFCTSTLAAGPFDAPPNSTMFFVSIPLDAKTPKEQAPAFGLTVRGSRDYQYITIDNRYVNRLLEDAAIGGIGAQWLIVGGIAAVAAVAVGSKDKSSTTQQQQLQQTAAVQQAAVVQQQQGQQSPSGQAPAPVDPCVCPPGLFARF